MTDRKKFIEILSEGLLGVDPTGFNLKFYQEHRFKLPDKEFNAWVQSLKDKTEEIILFAPAESGVIFDYSRNLDFAKKKGIPLIERLHFSAEGTVPAHLTPVEYTVLPTVSRRQAQRWSKKASIPSNMKHLNPLTGQPTGASKSARLSLPETQLLAASGLQKSLVEILGARAGDSGAGAALTGMLVNTGKASLKAISAFSTGVDASKYVRSILTSAMIWSNL